MEALDGNAIGGMLYHVFGGEMTASPDPAGGFVLTARLPLEAGRP